MLIENISQASYLGLHSEMIFEVRIPFLVTNWPNYQ